MKPLLPRGPLTDVIEQSALFALAAGLGLAALRWHAGTGDAAAALEFASVAGSAWLGLARGGNPAQDDAARR